MIEITSRVLSVSDLVFINDKKHNKQLKLQKIVKIVGF